MRTIGDIKVLMREPNDAQIAMLIRLAKAAEKDPQANFARLADVFFRIIEGLLVRPEDIEAMLDEIVEGRMSMKQIAEGLSAKGEDGKPATKARTRRVR